MTFDVQGLAILLVVLLLSMSIHEMLHAFAADWLGDDTARLMGRVSLNPLPHIDPIWTVAVPVLLYITHSHFLFGAAKPVPVNFNRLKYGEYGGAIVGAVGPFSNFLIAGIAAIVFNHTSPAAGTTMYQVLSLTISLNVGLFLFNMIPVPPLDGSRVLYAVAPRPIQEFMEYIESMGMISIVILVLLLSQTGALSALYDRLINFLAPGLFM